MNQFVTRVQECNPQASQCRTCLLISRTCKLLVFHLERRIVSAAEADPKALYSLMHTSMTTALPSSQCTRYGNNFPLLSLCLMPISTKNFQEECMPTWRSTVYAGQPVYASIFPFPEIGYLLHLSGRILPHLANLISCQQCCEYERGEHPREKRFWATPKILLNFSLLHDQKSSLNFFFQSPVTDCQ